ncbi:MAG: TPM domain-containing protein [Betaproteobacteria bacterium]|nr:TPM domain-containing protein [Betaproteobacteria bacterium]
MLALWLLIGAAAWAAPGELVAIPELARRVTDVTGTLGANDADRLESQLAAFEGQRGSQIAILIVPTTQPESVEQYSIRVAEAWRIGRGGQDDGVIIVVARNDRRVRIEVGYGLEGALPDALARRIIAETMAPRFKAGDYYGGLADGVAQIQKAAAGEGLAPPGPEAGAGREGGEEDLLGAGLIVAVVAASVLVRVLGRLLGGLASGGLVGFLALVVTGSILTAILAGLAALVLALFLGGRTVGRGGPWVGPGTGGWTGGGGSWGGGGGGSWGGGGGGFGGGGASGDW